MAFLKLFSVSVIIFICFNNEILAKQHHRPYYMSGQDLSSDTIYDNYYETNKKHQALDDPNFLARWPWLRDLMPPSDFTSENDGNQLNENPTDNNVENNIPIVYASREKVFDKIEEHSPEPLPIAVAHTERRNLVKDRDEKRNNNNYYMSLCHFKICNMGRKRNSRYLHYWNVMDRNTFINKAAI